MNITLSFCMASFSTWGSGASVVSETGETRPARFAEGLWKMRGTRRCRVLENLNHRELFRDKLHLFREKSRAGKKGFVLFAPVFKA